MACMPVVLYLDTIVGHLLRSLHRSTVCSGLIDLLAMRRKPCLGVRADPRLRGFARGIPQVLWCGP
jgi:hypothetical protein